MTDHKRTSVAVPCAVECNGTWSGGRPYHVRVCPNDPDQQGWAAFSEDDLAALWRAIHERNAQVARLYEFESAPPDAVREHQSLDRWKRAVESEQTKRRLGDPCDCGSGRGLHWPGEHK